MKKTIPLLVTFIGFIAMALSIRKEWGNPVVIACILYSLVVTVFFLAQLFGFVFSQTHYNEGLEEAKFSILEKEEKEWQNYLKG